MIVLIKTVQDYYKNKKRQTGHIIFQNDFLEIKSKSQEIIILNNILFNNELKFISQIIDIGEEPVEKFTTKYECQLYFYFSYIMLSNNK